jgi:flagellar hook-length control protein FliK
MSVAHSSVSGTPKSAASGLVGHAKGKAHLAEGAAPADTGDFSSLLTMLGADEAGDLLVGQDDPVQTLEGKDVVVDPELLLSQAMQLQACLPNASSVAENAEHPATERVLQAVTTEGALPAITEGAPQAVKTSLTRGVDALRSGQDTAPIEATGLPAKEKDVEKSPAFADVVKDGMKELPLAHPGASKSHTIAEAARSDKNRFVAEQQADKLLYSESRLAQSSALPQMTLTAGMGEPGVKQSERATERQALKQIGGSEGGAWGHQALIEAGRIDPPAATTAAPALSPEMMVAEQVNYWIGRDVQNAELKFDGLGEGAVKVSISLIGNEARVEFRTDQAATRQVLEGAVSHLKDLLGNEGLVLSSVSVGTSGSGGAGSREDKPPQRSRQAAVAVPQASLVDTARRPTSLAGRTVDLFV